MLYGNSGADVNAQTEETQETALTLACCGGFLEIAELLVNSGANLELGCSAPLMEASQEGHLELVKYLIAAGLTPLHSTSSMIGIVTSMGTCLSSLVFSSYKIWSNVYSECNFKKFAIGKLTDCESVYRRIIKLLFISGGNSGNWRASQ